MFAEQVKPSWLEVFETAVAYAIDDPSIDDHKKSLLKLLGLGAETFYHSDRGLYVEMASVKKVEQKLHHGSRIIAIYGFPGTGKTTIVTRALRQVEEVRPCCIIKFDFRAQEAILWEDSDTTIEKLLEDKILCDARDFCSRHDIASHDVVEFFVSPQAEAYAMSNEFRMAKQSLFDEYCLDQQMDKSEFHIWFRQRLIKNPDARFKIFADELILRLRLRDYLAYINKAMPSIEETQSGALVIIFFDNIDSISSNETRERFIQFVRNLHGKIGDVAKIIFAGRTATLSYHEWFDYGAHLADDIEIDYSEFIDKEALEREINRQKQRTGRCDNFAILDIKRRLQQQVRESFAMNLLNKRMNFIKKARDQLGASVSSVEGDYEDLRELYNQLVQPGSRILAPLDELSNHDYRLMFAHLLNMVSFVHEELKLRIDDLGLNYEERQFVLESILYYRLNDQESFFDFEAYNVFGELIKCFSDEARFGWSLTHLVLCVIYKLTNRSRGMHEYSHSATVGEVVNKMQEIGYEEAEVRSRIFQIYKKGEKYHGLIETSRFVQVKVPDDIRKDDPIWLTPRGAHLIDFLSHKYLYMVSCLRRSQWMLDGKLFTYSDTLPVTKKSIIAVLTFLLKVADLHAKTLVQVRQRLLPTHKGKWYAYYRKWYCIGGSTRPELSELSESGYLGDLLLINILRSHIHFLQRQCDLPGFEWIGETNAIEQLRALQTEFKIAINAIVVHNADAPNQSFEQFVNLEKLRA